MVKYRAVQGRIIGTTTAKPSPRVKTDNAEAYQYPKSNGVALSRAPSVRGICTSWAPLERNTALARYCRPNSPLELRNMVPRLGAQLPTGRLMKWSKKRGIDCSDMRGTRNVFSIKKMAF